MRTPLRLRKWLARQLMPELDKLRTDAERQANIALMSRMKPVSYTHLDVYKRQTSSCSLGFTSGSWLGAARCRRTPGCCSCRC